jgi:protoporphyrin/coproporphyrin ferrochelatase
VQQLARDGHERVDMICPGFPADCLETLEEIGQEVRDAFVAAGGQTYHYIACLNDRPSWIAALAGIALQHLQGWPLAPDVGDAAAQRDRALALGATQ